MDHLFDDQLRTDPSPGTHAETRFAILNRIRGPFWDEVRATLEDWFANLPGHARPYVRGQIRSSKDEAFDSAFWELYLHESMLRCGYTLQYEPKVSGMRQPDFLVDTGDGRFYMEAKNIGSSPDAAGKRLALVHDAINTLTCPAHLIRIEVKSVGLQNLPLRRFRVEAQRWLEELPPPDPAAPMDWDRDHFDWTDGEWSFRLFAFARPQSLLGTDMPPLAVLASADAGIVDDEGPLRKALSDKGKAYGPLTEPFVIAIRRQTLGDDRFAVMNGLYGSWQIQFGTDAAGRTTTRDVRARNGYWYRGDRWSHDSVSAVLLGDNISIWTVARDAPTCWMHPAPAQPLNPPPCWGTASLGADGQVQFSDPALRPHQLFGLPENWLSGDPFAD